MLSKTPQELGGTAYIVAMAIHWNKIRGIAIKLVLCIVTLSCLGWQTPAIAASGQAVIQSTSAINLTGIVDFTDTPGGLKIDARLSNLPSGQHGFHIHEFGSCAEAGNAAGGHYNPDNVKHGYLPDDGFSGAHAGDLGNIESNSSGTATYSDTISELALTNGNYPIAGHAMIIHEKQDDFGQPTGNAGGRIGCGAIVLVSP